MSDIVDDVDVMYYSDSKTRKSKKISCEIITPEALSESISPVSDTYHTKLIISKTQNDTSFDSSPSKFLLYDEKDNAVTRSSDVKALSSKTCHCGSTYFDETDNRNTEKDNHCSGTDTTGIDISTMYDKDISEPSNDDNHLYSNWNSSDCDSMRTKRTLLRSRAQKKRRKYDRYSVYDLQMELDENVSAETSSDDQNKSYDKPRNSGESKCSEYNSLLWKSISFLKCHLLPRARQQATPRWKNNETYEVTVLQDRSSKLVSQQERERECEMYQTFRNLDQRRDSVKTKANSSKQYAQLNHYNLKTSEQQSTFHKLKRIFLLITVVLISCLLLWKLYDVLNDQYNYLGYVETPSNLGRYNHYAVSTDAKPCAKVGSDLLAKGGSAVDAAIGTLLCMGVIIPNSLGLGGGCLMTIYDAKKKEAVIIDGRETAPDYATENMFANDSLKASRGPLSTGIPGELAAYWRAHQLYGKLSWSELFDSSIQFAEKGAPVVEHLAYALRAKNHARYITPLMAKLYTSNKTGQYYEEGEILVQKELAETLKRIRDNGAQEFYGGRTGQLFVDDLRAQGGNITLENLVKYEALVKKPLVFKLASDTTLHTQPLPGSGIVLSIVLRIMNELGYYKNHKPQLTFEGASLYYHRLVEAFKFAYAQRAGLEDMPDEPNRMELLMNKLTSEDFIKEAASKLDNKTHKASFYGTNDYFTEDHGTAHVSILDAEGSAAAVTTSVNLYFGSGLISPSTGITYNDVMDDFVSPNLVNKFNLPPTRYNRIRPGRRPLSSMAPSVFTDENGNVKLIIGGSGGSKITTAIASVSLRHCFLEEDVKTAIDGPRVHHQFLPNEIAHELNFPKDLLQSLNDYGHAIRPILDRSSVIMAIASSQVNGTKLITANSDYRKGGSVDGF